jgi:hypothetical protein
VNSFEGIPKEKSADCQSRNGFEEVAAARRGHATTAFGAGAILEAVKLRKTERSIAFFIVSLKVLDPEARLLSAYCV